MKLLFFDVISNGGDKRINDKLSKKGHDGGRHDDDVEISLYIISREIVDGVFWGVDDEDAQK